MDLVPQFFWFLHSFSRFDQLSMSRRGEEEDEPVAAADAVRGLLSEYEVRLGVNCERGGGGLLFRWFIFCKSLIFAFWCCGFRWLCRRWMRGTLALLRWGVTVWVSQVVLGCFSLIPFDYRGWLSVAYHSIVPASAHSP